MTTPIEAFKYFGLYCIVLATLIPAYLVVHWNAKQAETLSQHVAKDKTTYQVFALGSLVWQTLFILYMVGWFAPTLKLGIVYAVMLAVGTQCQILSAIIPDTTGLSSKLHKLIAYTMAGIMYANTIWMIASPTIIGFAHIFSYVSLVIMSILMILPLIYKKSKEHTLAGQSLYLLTFYATVLITGYVR